MEKLSETDLLTIECQRLAPQVFALCEILAPQGVRTRPWYKDPKFKVIDLGYRESSETLYVAERGAVILHTCEYSGHNGDSYGGEERLLGAKECHAKLRDMHAHLTEMAVRAQLDNIKRDEERRRLDDARYAVSVLVARKLGNCDVE